MNYRINQYAGYGVQEIPKAAYIYLFKNRN
jgi:hypothetical protein